MADHKEETQVGETAELAQTGNTILMAVHVALSYGENEINYRKWRHIKGKEVADQSFWLKGLSRETNGGHV